MYSFLTNFLEPVAYLVYFIAFALRLKADASAPIKALTAFYLLATVLMTDASFKVIYPQVNNIWSYNTLLFTSLLATGLYAYRLFQARRKKRTIVVLFGSTLLYFMVRNVVQQKMGEFDSLGLVFLSVSVVIFSFMYFHHLLQHVTELRITYDFNFWVVSGFLLYYLGSFFIFLGYNYLTSQYLSYALDASYRKQASVVLTILWGVHNVFLCVSALMTLFGSVWATYRSQLR